MQWNRARLYLEALRETLAVTGTKKGCNRGECGACTVHVDRRRALSCMALGQLTAVLVAPAIANAVYHATGKRIRELPITNEKLP